MGCAPPSDPVACYLSEPNPFVVREAGLRIAVILHSDRKQISLNSRGQSQ